LVRLSRNPNISLDIIENYINNWQIYPIEQNIFFYHDILYKRELKKDIEKRRIEVKAQIKDIFYNDICGEILKYISYD
jgi:hypothetical protein